ncbi:hypothetical protein OC842_005314 [Tilletia horrida]|uniref:N-acetyltransferase domain-containing protein n=1 Tax=Tilletia horrida TaxID=155126 RepID=A0AAN6G7Z3_9BASI|nr:hypothetical protein OC842_005314 [Tilletia horrida]
MMWLSMAPETDPAAPPIQDHVPPTSGFDNKNNSSPGNNAPAEPRRFVGVGAPEMLIPFNLRSRTASSGASSGGSPSVVGGLGGSIASLRMSSFTPTPNPIQHEQEQEDDSDEEPCCTPDHALANDAMVLLASSSSSTSSAIRDTSVGMPSHYHSAGTAPVKLVKTPGAHDGRKASDYFSMTLSSSSTRASSSHVQQQGNAGSGSDSTITSSTRSSPPSFDFRNTFAPIAFNKGRAAAKINGGGGIEFAGKQWSGKTAHAVEQEMEALGDRAIMSYAPDASYLAMRLEGLRRNLEASNWERRPSWVGWQEDQEEEEEAVKEQAQAEADKTQEADMTLSATAQQQAVRSPPTVGRKSALGRLAPAGSNGRAPKSPIARSEIALPPAPATSLIDAEYARVANLPAVSNIEGAQLSAAERSRLAQASFPATPAQGKENAAYFDDKRTAATETPSPQTPPPLDPAIRAAALDARLEIRQLKRDDVVQVRELHCFHGDGNKSPGRETYTMSAGFLLRLLVDEKHVAVVAVKRPIPAPESPLPSDLASSIHSRFSPGGMHHQHHHHLHHQVGSPGLPRVSSSLSRTPVYSVARSTSSMEAEEDEDEEREDEEEEEENDRSPTSPSFFSSPADAIGSRTEYTQATSLLDSDEEQNADSSRDDDAVQPVSPAVEQTQPAQAENATRNGTPAPGHEGAAAGESALPAHGLTLPPSVLPQSDSTLYEKDADKPILAGPLPVAPPLAVRVMAAPPPSHRMRSSDALLEGTETVVGVATAQLTTTEPLANELWPGIDADDTSARGAAVEQVHVLTLSVAPDERSQGLGARLLERLIEECRIRIGHNSLRKAESISLTGRARSMRVVVECHPSNARAVELYDKAGFARVEGPQGTKKNFYRGDDRIPLAYRLKVGGTDAHVYERRFELP